MLKFLTPKEVAKILRVTPHTVYTEIQKGNIKAKKVGRLWRIPETELKPEEGENEVQPG